MYTERRRCAIAKDGTNRGGRRAGAGKKPVALVDRITEGKAAKILEIPDLPDSYHLEGEDMGDAADLSGEDMPSASDYLSTKQKDGRTLGADIIYEQTWLWLRERRCEKLVNRRLIEAYAQSFARYIQCEEATSTYGLLGKHPTTGAAMTSPFVQMSQSFQKQANLIWYEIYEIVKQNCTTPFTGYPQDGLMERLLLTKK